jgi:hypothetical protein
VTTTSTRRGSTTLGEEARFFWSQTNPRIMAATLVAVLAARLVVGDWRLDDVWIALGLIAAQPFVEWVIHVAVLHYRPVTILGREVDFLLARKHREHHADPTVVELIFVPLPALLRLIPLVGLGLWLLLPTPAALTAMAVASALLRHGHRLRVDPLPRPLRVPAEDDAVPGAVACAPAPPPQERAVLVRA